jgi:hypothetical protein
MRGPAQHADALTIAGSPLHGDLREADRAVAIALQSGDAGNPALRGGC